MFGDAYKVTVASDDIRVQKIGSSANEEDGETNIQSEEMVLSFDRRMSYVHGNHIAVITLNGVSRCIQILKKDNNKLVELYVQMYGALYDIFVHDTIREYELSKYMKPPPEIDTSNDS